jgi:hypothetical protein
MVPDGGPQIFNPAIGVGNNIKIRWDGTLAWYTITAPGYSAPTLNPVALTFTTTKNAAFTDLGSSGTLFSSTSSTAFSGAAVSGQQIAANKDFELIVRADATQLVGLNNASGLEAFSNWEHYIWIAGTAIYTGANGVSTDSGWTTSVQTFFKIERISGSIASYYRIGTSGPWVPVRTWSGTNNSAYYVCLNTTSTGVVDTVSLKVQP